jgi:regulator of nucleoside diphosphate kinase
MRNKKRTTEPELPPLLVTNDDMQRLSVLANSSMGVFPRVAHFLAREMDRANVVPDDSDLHGVVRMGCRVVYRDESTNVLKELVLVYPHEADIMRGRVSVLTPVGAALIGLSIGQTIEFETPTRQTRRLTVLGVSG